MTAGGLEAFVHQHGPGIRSMLRRMLPNEDEVLDVYQDCLCQLVDRSDRLALRSVRAYAYKTAANLAIETIRRRRRREAHWTRVVTAERERREAHGLDSDRDGEPGHQHWTTQVRNALVNLPRHLHDVVVLRDLGELPYERVGAILGIGSATARVYRRQAIVRLGGMLAGAGPN